jgi:hypothetical protein
VLGLVAGDEYAVTGRSIGCGGNPSNANQVFWVTGMADSAGALVISQAVAIPSVVRSMWLAPTDGSRAPACSMTVNFSRVATGDPNGDGALGFHIHINPFQFAAAIVEKRPSGQARLSITLDGLSGGDEFSVQGTGAACNQSVRPAQRYFAYELKNVHVTSFKSRTVTIEPGEFVALRSVRIKNKTDGTKWGCVPLSIIGILRA